MKGLVCILLLFAVGCHRPAVVIHPIEKVDIIAIEKGSWPEEPPVKDGFFMSSDYVKEVMEAKID